MRDKERQIRQEIDSRLDAHRRDRNAPSLGMDVVCTVGNLMEPEERTILLALLPMALSQRMAETTMGELCQHWGAVAVSDLLSVLDPQGLREQIRLRRLFRTRSTLVAQGLIEVNRGGGLIGPETLLAADVRLSLPCFATIVGDPEATTEAQ